MENRDFREVDDETPLAGFRSKVSINFATNTNPNEERKRMTSDVILMQEMSDKLYIRRDLSYLDCKRESQISPSYLDLLSRFINI